MSQTRIWNRFARSYARRPVADQPSYERKLAMTAARLTPEMELLEIGCGTGSTALIHAARVRRIEAIDISDRMIAIAREKAAAQGVSNVDFRVGTLDDVAEDARFDAALVMSLLHLLPDPQGTLDRLTGHLKPGGYLFSSTICLGDMPGLVSRILPYLGKTGLLPTITRFTRPDLEAMHRAAGLVILEDFQPGPDKALFLVAQRPA